MPFNWTYLCFLLLLFRLNTKKSNQTNYLLHICDNQLRPWESVVFKQSLRWNCNAKSSKQLQPLIGIYCVINLMALFAWRLHPGSQMFLDWHTLNWNYYQLLCVREETLMVTGGTSITEKTNHALSHVTWMVKLFTTPCNIDENICVILSDFSCQQFGPRWTNLLNLVPIDS